MSITQFDPKVTKTSASTDLSRKTEDNEVKAHDTDKSTFSAADSKDKAWKAMTKNVETPSIIGEMEDAAAGIEFQEPTANEVETAYLANLMFGDYGNVRTLDNKHIQTIEDKAPIEVPTEEETREMFKTKALQEDPYPVYERFVLLDSTLHELLEINAESITEMNPDEAQVAMERIDEIKELIQRNQVNVEIAYYYLINARAKQRAALEDLEQESP